MSCDPNSSSRLGRQLFGALTFSSNWLEITDGNDYFRATDPRMFETFWSLAVEEQFYLVWPIVFGVVLALARTPRQRARTAATGALVSAALMALLYRPDGSNWVYHATHTHAFGLLIGAAIAFAADGAPAALGGPEWQRLRRWIGFPALAGLVALCLTLDGTGSAAYRGGLLVASLLAGAVIAALPGTSTSFQALHRLRPLEWVGERSYGIYLWHWPLILLVGGATPVGRRSSDAATALAAMAATFALSAAMYRFVEMPIRRQGFRGTFRVFVASVPSRPARRLVLASSVALLVVVGVVVATAPDKSAVQLSVERGLRQIEAAGAEPTVEPGEDGTAPTTAPAAGVTSTTAPPPAWPEDQAVPSGERITGFGDSVLAGAAPAMYDRFPGILLDAVPIRQWKDAPGVIESALAAGTVRPVVVLNFGTNAGLESEESMAGLRNSLDLLGPTRRVVLVNTMGVSDWVPTTNERLAAVAAEHPNAAVADWYGLVDDRPDLLHDDRTHPNWDGISAYSALVAATLEQLGPG